jgi:ParB/RepB/Spo0J family partition protein
MAIAVQTYQQQLAVELIDVPANVRDLDTDHVAGLAASIAVQGVLVPLVVRDAGGGRYQLVAGFHRFAAVRQLGAAVIDTIPVVVRDAEHEDADRAVENLSRKQLRADEEARALKAMLERGYSEDGAAKALGWPKARVTARVRLLALPEPAIALVGAGVIPLSAVEQLLAIGRVSAPLLDTIVAHITTEPWVAERLTSQPGWLIDAAARAAGGAVFVASMTTVDRYDVAALKLGKKTDALWEQAGELANQLDRYSYGPTVRFADVEIDQARAAGVTIEFDRAAPIIADRKLYRELVKQAIARTVAELEQKVADRAAERTQSRSSNRNEPADPAREAKRERDRQLRELADQAHGVNLDVGASLLNGLSTVDPAADMDVARFLVYGLLGPDFNSSPYGERGNRVHELAVTGIRLRIAYGAPHKADTAEPAVKWLWRYLDGARCPGDLFGRALVVVAAQRYASRLVVPGSQRARPIVYAAHGDRAEKALAKIAGPHLPASLKRLQKAIDAVERDYQAALATAPAVGKDETPDAVEVDVEDLGDPSADTELDRGFKAG